MLRSSIRRGAVTFDRWFSARNTERLNAWVVRAAIFGLLLHLAVICVNDWLIEDPGMSEVVGHNVLSALYTPFSFVLFFEVLLMVVAIPHSFSRAIGVQFQIMALIIMRSAFEELGGIQDLSRFADNFEIYSSMLFDLATGLLLFLVIGIYFRLTLIQRAAGEGVAVDDQAQHRLDRFIELKKTIAAALAVLMVALAVITLVVWIATVTGLRASGPDLPNVNGVFYREYFSVMIFADVFVVLYSLREHSGFEVVFRNVGFVISTIVMRVYFVSPHPYNLVAAISGVLFGTLTLAIAVAYVRLGSPKR